MNKKPLPIDRLLTPAEVAEAVCVSRRTVYDWLATGYLPAVKVGRTRLWGVRLEDVRALQAGRDPGMPADPPQPAEPTVSAPPADPRPSARKGTLNKGRRG